MYHSSQSTPHPPHCLETHSHHTQKGSSDTSILLMRHTSKTTTSPHISTSHTLYCPLLYAHSLSTAVSSHIPTIHVSMVLVIIYQSFTIYKCTHIFRISSPLPLSPQTTIRLHIIPHHNTIIASHDTHHNPT